MTEWKNVKSVFECCKEHNPDRRVERIVGTELEPSKRIEGNLYKLVDTIFYTTTDTLPLWAGFKERGFKLYTRAIGTYSEDFKLYHNDNMIAEYDCPPSKRELIYHISKHDLEFALFIILGYAVRATIATRKAMDAWYVVRDARNAAWDVAWEAWDVARKAWDVAWKARNAWYTREAARSALRKAFKQTIKCIKTILEES